MLNRAAILLKYKKPAIDWINDADPYSDDPGITVEDVNTERTVYLVRDEVADSPEATEEWLKANQQVLFERELDGWYSDPTIWPKDRSYNQFKKWFEVECHSVVEDTLEEPIIDDEL